MFIGGSSWNPEVETCCLRKKVTAGNPVANISGFMHMRTSAHTHTHTLHPRYIICESKRLLYGPLCLPPGSICSLNMSHGFPHHLDQDEAVCIMRILSSALSHSSFPLWSSLLLLFRTGGRRMFRIGYPTCFLGRQPNTLLLLTLATLWPLTQGEPTQVAGHPVAPDFPSLAFCLPLSAAQCGASRCHYLCQRYHLPWLTESPLSSCELVPITCIMCLVTVWHSPRLPLSIHVL